jgi:type IV pilus assembly protein PilX
MNRSLRHRPQSQRGAVLAVVLILLLVMTLLGLASLRGTLMETRMSANQVDRSLSFQAAEAGLREGEAAATGILVSALPGGGAAGSGCANGLCAMPNPAATTQVWQDPLVWAAAPSVSATNFLGKTATPKYIVELLAVNVPPTGSCTTSGDVSPDAECHGTEKRYRITAQSDATDRAQVMLQSIYSVP